MASGSEVKETLKLFQVEFWGEYVEKITVYPDNEIATKDHTFCHSASLQKGSVKKDSGMCYSIK